MSPETELLLRQEIIDSAQALAAQGLSPGLSGNLSARTENGLLITPSAMAYEDLLPEDIVHVEGSGQVPEGQRKPSSELPFHGAIYQAFEEAEAVIHCHSPKASALSCLRKPIPAFHYMVAISGGPDIRVADYFTPATDKLAEAVLEALKGRNACLMANHGQVVFAGSLREALALAIEIENLSAMYLDALAAGDPVLLSAAEMQDVLVHFKSYRPAS